MIGSLDHRITGSPDHRITGSLDDRITGSPDYRITGSTDHRITESPDLPLTGPLPKLFEKSRRGSFSEEMFYASPLEACLLKLPCSTGRAQEEWRREAPSILRFPSLQQSCEDAGAEAGAEPERNPEADAEPERTFGSH